MRLSSRSHVAPRVCGTPVPAPNGPNCLVSEGAWGRISGLRARVTTLTLVPRALAWFFPLPVSAPRLGDRLFDQPHGLVRLDPGVQGRLRQARPPGLVLKAEHPLRVATCQADQAVATAFFRAYAGSGLVSQRLARFQPTPRRFRVARIVSPLTRSGVSPCSKLTWA